MVLAKKSGFKAGLVEQFHEPGSDRYLFADAGNALRAHRRK